MLLNQFLNGDSRTVKAKKNIIASFFFKGIDSIVYLLLVPITLDYLNQYEYGIWLTISSILMWINSFDIGLGNGMRNKLAEAIARNDKQLARIYVSTTFFMLIFLMGGIVLIGSMFESLINWYDILNTSPDKVLHLSKIVYYAFVIFCVNFIFKFIGNVYLAMQLPAINNLMVMSGHLISLVVIFILTKVTTGNLLYIAIVYSVSPLFVYLVAYPITFYKIYPFLRPSLFFVKFKYLKNLLNISIHFFLLQLSALLLFSFSNILISHMFGPESVTPYNIAYRYFSIVLLLVNLVLAPIWSATTDASIKNDYKWIHRTLKTLHKFLFMLFILLIIMVFFSTNIYQIWVGSEVKIPIILTIAMATYTLILIWSLTYSNILNGLGKLKLQTINTIICAILFLPLCYTLGKVFGLMGIILGMCILNLSGLILNKLQLGYLLKGNAKGVWNK